MKTTLGPIKSFALGIYDGPHATPKEAEDGPIFLGIKNVTPEGHLDFSEIRHVSPEEFPKWTRRAKPMKDDVVFSYEATLHRYAIIPDDFEGCLGRRMALVRPNKQKLSPRFLHYYFMSPKWRAKIESNIISGATVDRIPIKDFPEFEVEIPDLRIQTRIAETLSRYDDLIANNRKRIGLLEESARMLFREWFVHLRFPGHERVKRVDGVPVGWRKGGLGDFCEAVRKSVMPEEVSPDTPYIGLEHIPRRSITLSSWETAEKVTSTKLDFKEGDILFGKIRPYFHKVGFALLDGITSSDAIVIRPVSESVYALVLMTVSSDEFVAMTSQTSREGSKMPRADWKIMVEYPLLCPPDYLLAEFERYVNPVLKQLKTLALETHRLQSARDMLLPRLMSGEVAV